MSDTLLFVAFVVLSLVTLSAATLVVTTTRIIHSALFLVLALLGIAGIYVLLAAEFVAGVQVLIYVGAITVLVLFAIMLTHGPATPESNPANRQWPLALLVSGALFVLLLSAIQATAWPTSTATLPANTVQTVGAQLLTTYVVPFEVASLLLLAAMIGAVVIAREG
jgi:NADH-quinone oxidoreductase subunit J